MPLNNHVSQSGDRSRTRQTLARGSLFLLAFCLSSKAIAVEPHISEFMAVNVRTLSDADGDYSDWIEIHNPAPTAISLHGWYLTDSAADLTRWQFPDVVLPAGAFLVVFASDKDRRDPARELHTNFKLTSAGEYLALVRSDGTTVVSEFAPAFPEQVADVSYGVAFQPGPDVVLLPTNATTEFLVPTATMASNWMAPDYVPGPEWTEGLTGLGYERGTAAGARILVIVDTSASGTGLKGNQELVYHLATNLGHQVTVMDDGQSATSQAAQHDLVIISSTASAESVNTKFRNVPVPVFQGDAGLADDFLLSAAGGSLNDQTSITVTAAGADHPVMAGLTAGMYPVRTTPTTFHTASNTQLAPGAQVLATAANGQPAVLVVEPGATLNDGSPAAALRIHLFFGDASVAGVNRAGLALFNAAVNYALSYRSAPAKYAPFISTDVESVMADVNSGLLTRIPFQFTEPWALDSLALQVRYDDGFAAYLNGVEILRRNAPAILTWNAAALSARSADQAVQPESIDLSAHRHLLRSGANLLALHGLNLAAHDNDFLLQPELVATTGPRLTGQYYTMPTPRAANQAGLAGLVPPVQFNVDRGYVTSPFLLTLSTAMPEAQIRYTTNGSMPTASTGWVYAGPIPVHHTLVVRAAAFRPGYAAAEAVTASYLFVDDIVHQPRDVSGWPRPTQSVGQGSRQHDYEMDARVTGAPAYADDLIAGWLEIPTLSLAVHQPDMWDANGNGGFYRGTDVEKPVSVELICPQAPEKNVFALGGIRAHSHDRLKRSLRLTFRAEYGPGKFISSLFQDAPVNGGSARASVNSIVLRGGNNRCWARSWNPDRTTYTEDQWYRDTQIAMSGVGAHGNFVHLFINGLYWGLYNPVERPDDAFAAEHLGGAKEDWFSVSHSGVHGGNPARWNYLKGALSDKDMAVAAHYAELTQYLEVTHFIDYLLASWFIGLTDWPGNNWWGANRNHPPGPFYFFAWDGEWSWGVGMGSSTRAWVHPDFRASAGSTSNPLVKLWHAARKNADFMTLLADRVFEHTSPEGALGDAAVIERWLTWSNYVRHPVVAESARWGDTMDAATPRTRDVHWQNEIERMRGLMVGNGAQLVSALRAQGYYPSVDPPALNPAAGRWPAGTTLALSNPNPSGTIYFTMDGSDPRLPGGNANPSALTAPEQTLRISSRIKARVRAGAEWSALNQAVVLITNAHPLRLTELMYHPAPPSAVEAAAGWTNASDFEFIELYHAGAVPLALDGWRFDAGVSASFTNGALAPGAYVLVVANPSAFAWRYGSNLPIAGTYSGALDNAGERLRLRDGFGEVLLDFAYDDAWHPGTDGSGYSLVRIDPAQAGAWESADAWRPSARPDGSPGLADPEPNDDVFEHWHTRRFSAAELAETARSGPGGDWDWDGFSNFLEYALGLNPRQPDIGSALTAHLEGERLSVVYRRARALTDVTYEMQQAEALAGPWNAANLAEELIHADATHETVRVTATGPFVMETSHFLRLQIRHQP